jgi:uncharacterized protein (TIGR02145 family)
MKNILRISGVILLVLLINSCKKDDNNAIKDGDSNIYTSVLIGTQIWMVENLKTTKYNDGTAIPNITDNSAWKALATGAYGDYDNNPVNSTLYGRLYNWYAVDNGATNVASNGGKNICPTGWHVPADDEWYTLENYLRNNGYGYEGSEYYIAKSMAATSGWWTTYGTPGTVGNDQASNNSSGFTAIPGGQRNYPVGTFSSIGNTGSWWSSTEKSTTSAYGRAMTNNHPVLWGMSQDKHNGYSIRCIKDN